MVNILQNKRESSRFKILAEIAANQPNLSQNDVAKCLGLSTQAISDYIRELVTEGLVTSNGRAHYSTTNKGIDWLLEGATELERYAKFVTEDIVDYVPVWSALAESDLVKGEQVSLEMRDGILHASKKEGPNARGIITSDVRAGEDVGVSDLKGLISLEVGTILVCKVPEVQDGGSRKVDIELLKSKISGEKMIGALGTEAMVALRKAGRSPDIIFGAKASVIEAAYHGISSVLVCIDEQVPSLLYRLKLERMKYEVIDLTLA
jgi:putative transcriptional regulator